MQCSTAELIALNPFPKSRLRLRENQNYATDSAVF